MLNESEVLAAWEALSPEQREEVHATRKITPRAWVRFNANLPADTRSDIRAKQEWEKMSGVAVVRCWWPHLWAVAVGVIPYPQEEAAA